MIWENLARRQINADRWASECTVKPENHVSATVVILSIFVGL
jgi:hypothetical protein